MSSCTIFQPLPHVSAQFISLGCFTVDVKETDILTNCVRSSAVVSHRFADVASGCHSSRGHIRPPSSRKRVPVLPADINGSRKQALGYSAFFGQAVGRTHSRKCSPARTRVLHVSNLITQPSGEHEEKTSAFSKRLEQAWAVTKQPIPMACESCSTQGYQECPWCKGTGFFILGDNMLCEVPSRNTTCHVCEGKGTLRCDDCKGTGFRARWMGQPLKKISKQPEDS
eukprot:jgi/Mesen1/10883/ME000935S10218